MSQPNQRCKLVAIAIGRVAFGFMVSAGIVWPGPAFAQSSLEELEEVKRSLQETQASMERMMQQYQEQIEALQQRIVVLENQSTVAAKRQEQMEEALIKSRVERARKGSALADTISLNGYYDFIYVDGTDSRNGSFLLNELSVFLSGGSEDEQWNFFGELEFELFDGDEYFLDDGDRTSELEIETAWLEYALSDEIQFRGGKLLLPQYWQTYHYPNLTLSTRPPAMVGRIFPKNIIGVQARGQLRMDRPMSLSYAAYVGNGGDSEISEIDRNQNKAFGGRLTMHFGQGETFDTFDVGASGYTGRDHSDEDETVLGLDAQIRYRDLEFLTEFAWGDQQTILGEDPDPFMQVSTRTMGYYLQLGYNFRPRWHTYYRFDELDLWDDGASPLDSHQNTLGLNFRPRSNISLKLEIFRAEFDRDSDPFHGLATAIVYNF